MLPLPDSVSRSSLLACGYSDASLRRLRQSDPSVRLRRGRYLAPPAPTLTPELRHVVRAVEIGQSLRSGGVISHTSAALLHGLPMIGAPPERIDVTWPGSPGRRPTHNVRPRRAQVHDDEITSIRGVHVTSVARTVYDLARSRDVRRRDALGVADAALHENLCTLDDLTQTLRANAGRPGCGRARSIISFADPRAESIGESLTRALFGSIGMPEPELQVEVDDAREPGFARVDFLFFEQDTVAEFDGKVKFERYLRPGETPAQAAYREKVREDRIRDCGLQVVRFVWRDLADPVATTRRLTEAFVRSGCAHWQPGPPRFLP